MAACLVGRRKIELCIYADVLDKSTKNNVNYINKMPSTITVMMIGGISICINHSKGW
jgi:hypothetical protein